MTLPLLDDVGVMTKVAAQKTAECWATIWR